MLIFGKRRTELLIFYYFCTRNDILREREPEVFQEDKKLTTTLLNHENEKAEAHTPYRRREHWRFSAILMKAVVGRLSFC